MSTNEQVEGRNNFLSNFLFPGPSTELGNKYSKNMSNEGNILNINFVITFFPERTVTKCMLYL